MPTLGLITACQVAIIEQDTKNVSLVNLFSGIKITITADEPPPTNAILPREWSIACGWDGVEGDDGKEFNQVVEIYLPDGTPFVSRSVMKFSVQPEKRHYSTSKLAAFPIGQAGKFLIQVWVEFEGQPITEKTSLRIGVEHEFVATSQQPPSL